MRTIYPFNLNKMVNSQYKHADLISKNRLGRHTINRPIRFEANVLFGSKRMSATQAFTLFTRRAIPIMEDNIEVRLLEEFTKNLNQLEKDEVYQAYI